MRGKKGKITECIHVNRSHYSNGLCKSCYVIQWNNKTESRRIEFLQKNRDRSTSRDLMNNFGLTVSDYESLLAQQNGACLICKGNACKYRLAVDHNHKTGKIRGLLCMRCNTKLGWYEKFAKQIAQYLSQSKED